MKQILFFMALALAVVSCNKNASNKTNADVATVETKAKAEKTNQLNMASSNVEEGLPLTSVSWDRLKHDFGNIKEGEIVKTTFVITNTGSNPLVINKAKGSCGCTVPKVAKNVPIAPGETTEIEVQFNSNGRPGKQTKSVELYGNFNPSPSRATITSQVEAKPKPDGSASTDAHAGHNH